MSSKEAEMLANLSGGGVSGWASTESLTIFSKEQA